MKKGHVTLKDIAKHLNVSVATVSRALKDFPDIGADMKQAVQKLAEEWNYRPNTLAVGLRKQQTKVIGVLIPEIVHYFFSSVISGVMSEVEQHGYSIMLFQTNESMAREKREIDIMLNSRVDGLLISLANESTASLTHLETAQQMGVPVVLFDKVDDRFACSQVIVDDYAGGYEATKHLIEQGCQRIAHIKGPKEPKNAFDRLSGYLDALRDHGIAPDPSLVLECVQVTFEEGYEFAQRLLALPNRPDGLFAITDLVAIGAMMAIKDAGLSIPRDIALIGFSNWQMAKVVEPPLSSIHQPGYEMGQAAARILLSEIGRPIPEKFQKVVLETALVARGSSLRK
jgi:LacI family transcriptional regulator